MSQKLWAEGLGTLILVMTGIGSGIMGVNLAGGNMAIVLFADAFATGLILYLLITVLGPISGAHLNPAVTLLFVWRGDTPPALALAYLGAQVAGALLAVGLTHAMFDLPLVQFASTVRTGPVQRSSRAHLSSVASTDTKSACVSEALPAPPRNSTRSSSRAWMWNTGTGRPGWQGSAPSVPATAAIAGNTSGASQASR